MSFPIAAVTAQADAGADPGWEVDSRDIVNLLGDGGHLVGFSYGGVGALHAAARRPQAIRSLTVIEPPAFGIVRGHAEADALVARLETVYAAAPGLTPEEFDSRFDAALGFDHSPEIVDQATRARLDAARRERPPWEARPALATIAAARVPVLVVSGAWHPAFTAVCERLVRDLHGDHLVLPGGHAAQHRPGFNERLIAFWASVR